MVIDIIAQTEINKKEYKLYPFREWPFQPNFSVRPLCGKFYARHDFPDPTLLDESLEKAVLKQQMVLSKDKYKEPLTVNMEYGWYIEPPAVRLRFDFHFPKKSSWITQIGSVIASEDQKNPKKLFTGIAFKV